MLIPFFMYHIKSKFKNDLTKMQTEKQMVTKAELATSTNLAADLMYLWLRFHKNYTNKNDLS